jgi:hypothetical protein
LGRFVLWQVTTVRARKRTKLTSQSIEEEEGF